MSFGWPAALVALLIIPLALLAYALVQRRRARYAVRFTNLDLLANVVETTPGWRRHLPAALYLAAIAALVLALARPEVTVSVPREEATVILVTDVSGSMNARDVEPTRLAAAQEAAEVLLDELPEGFQVSLVTFSTSVQTRVSPTIDREAIREALYLLRANGGTAMGDALAHALEMARPPAPIDPVNGQPVTPQDPAGEDEEPVPAVIVLLSDGFNTAGTVEPIVAAQDAVALQVPVFTIALGTPDGVAEVTDAQGNRRLVRVPPDEVTLRQIAEMTEARFFSAPSADELRSVYEDLGSKIGYEEEPREVTHWFAAAAAAFVVAGGGLALLWFNRFP